MKYAKLINNEPIFAPNPIMVGENYIGNPPGSIYTSEGYKPVIYSDPPSDPVEGYQWVEKWVETSENIVQEWEQVEKTEYDGDEAMDFIFGGEN